MDTAARTTSEPGEDTHGGNLALLYQGVLTGIVRVHSGRQPITDIGSFRKRMKDVLAQIEREAVRSGFTQQDVSDTNYAVVAFLDEVVMNSDARTQWSLLQTEMYERAHAGEAFFDQLQRICGRRDSPQTAAVLEVHLLCLLLGYQGRYASGHTGELRQVIADLRERIEAVSGRRDRLSPAGLPSAGPAEQPPAPQQSASRFLRVGAIAVLGLTGLLWLLFWVLLRSQADSLRQAVLGAVGR